MYFRTNEIQYTVLPIELDDWVQHYEASYLASAELADALGSSGPIAY